jgi:uncharacterized protein (TIGR03067 family)
MKLCRLLGVIAILAIVGFAPAPFPRKDRTTKKDDFATLQGMWRMTYQESGGTPSQHNYKVRVKGNRWSFISLGDRGEESPAAGYYLALDQNASPPAMEWGNDEKGTSGWIASYRLRGRELTVIYDSGTLKDRTRRPTNFEGRVPHKMIFEFIGRE